MAWERNELRAAIEALLFASDEPVSVATLCDVLPGANEDLVRSCIQELKVVYASEHGGLQIMRVAGGYHIRTRAELSPWVERLLRKRRRMRLSQAALETLAIIAYKQPVTRVEMESIRGVDVGGVLGTLLERNLITIRGRSKGPGRPLLYATTKEFLDHFGLNDLNDLPSLEELESLLAERDEAAVEDVPVPAHVQMEGQAAEEAEETSATVDSMEGQAAVEDVPVPAHARRERQAAEEAEETSATVDSMEGRAAVGDIPVPAHARREGQVAEEVEETTATGELDETERTEKTIKETSEPEDSEAAEAAETLEDGDGQLPDSEADSEVSSPSHRVEG